MASVIGEAVVGKFCEIAIEMAVQKLAEEAKLVVNFRKDFIWLNKQLTYVRGFLKSADQQSRHNEDVKQWVENIRVISWLAEDICEVCAVESMYGNNSQSCGFSCNQWIFSWRIGRKIKDIKDRIRSIIEEGKELKLVHEIFPANEASPSTSQSVEWKRSYLLPSDSRPVGIQSKVDDMLRLLDNNASPVIAVVGMGGMGKTYLLRHVYNNITERYEKSIWLSVSQSYSIYNLQKALVAQLDEDLSKQIKDSDIDKEVLAQKIHEKLQGKRCLVVLDDVWRAPREDDLLSQLGLPTGNNSQCQIVVSTRSKGVCTNLNAEVYEMQYLSDEDSWRLFCVYAFEEKRGPQPHLEEVGHKIVKQCGNLPLAIKTIAASLAKTTMPRDWESKLHQLEGVVAADGADDRIMPILRLSYDSLPARLKACFAYLSFFPEDEEIDCEYLINLWIGEGFIPGEGEGQWDAAWDCLFQLANLCLLQLWEEPNRYDFLLTKYCRIHDLLLDLAIHISRENKCVFSVEEASKDTSGDWCRILLSKRDINDDAISERRPVCLRTLSLSQNEEIRSIPANLFTAMRGLRVLDLSWTRISTLPESIGKMKLLKVLNLDGKNIEKVPECVRHLKSLLFLALPDRCKKLPVWMNEVKCLQHLECRGYEGPMAKGISKLVSLRTLRSGLLDVSVGEDKFMRSEDFGNMTELQELRLNVNHEMELKGMEEGIFARLLKMRRLLIHNSTETELELPEKMTAMEDLESLTLYKFTVPSRICVLANLRELFLCKCDCFDYSELQIMPNLVSLDLSQDYRCRELPKAFGKARGFPHLRFLHINSFLQLEEFPELEEGAMACLEELNLHDCSRVKKVGEGLELLKRLKLFSYEDSGTNELRETFKEGGEYWNKIKAINPHIEISC